MVEMTKAGAVLAVTQAAPLTFAQADPHGAKVAAEHGDEYRRILAGKTASGRVEEWQLDAYRRIWAHTHGHLPQPANDQEAEFTLHMARTNVRSIPLRLRRYSARWLEERGFGSFLPDELKRKHIRGQVVRP